jgi:hypothetical protein
MTTEQLAIIVPGVSVVLVAGIGAWWQVQINKQTVDHQAKLAFQARVASVYEELLEMIGWQMEAVDATKPIITMGEPSKPPEAPDTDRIRKVQARIGVHAGRKVKDIVERWARRRNEFFIDAWYLDGMQNDHVPSSMTNEEFETRWGIKLGDQWAKVDGDRKDLHALVREIEDAVNAELRG